MNSFFGEDTQDELIQQILKEKKDSEKLPRIIDEICTSHLVQSTIKTYEDIENEEKNTSNNFNKTNDNYYKENIKIIEKYSNEEKLNFNLKTHIFSFHIKKNGKINADLYFIPYKSQENKNVITEYTYKYDYYDIYSENIEQINKSIHSNKHKMLSDTENTEHINKKIKIKQEKTTENQNENENKNESKIHSKNFEKWLVHFRGRLFVGNNVNYDYFNIKTYLATIQQNDKMNDHFNYINKKIQTYNLIKNAIYWKQDEYPDISDQNIQKLLFLLILPSLYNYEDEEELKENIVF